MYDPHMGSPPPVVLCFSGHDPSGGAGVHADIEAIVAADCHAASAVTCLTVQDTHDVKHLSPTDPKLFRQQAEAVLNDLPVACIKIGLISDAAICREIAELVAQYRDIPVVLDPVLAAGGGRDLAGEALLESMRMDLLPQVYLATPNSVEARRISGKEELSEAAPEILRLGCKHTLITGTHEQGAKVTNTLYSGSAEETHSLEWPRLPGSYHGSGCTLSAAIAARIALGQPINLAVTEAQEYTWQTLDQANRFGSGQAIPNRCFKLS